VAWQSESLTARRSSGFIKRAILSATQAFQMLKLIFLQLEKEVAKGLRQPSVYKSIRPCGNSAGADSLAALATLESRA
jgi:hypothetical protein